jgi:hypothetical protein
MRDSRAAGSTRFHGISCPDTGRPAIVPIVGNRAKNHQPIKRRDSHGAESLRTLACNPQRLAGGKVLAFRKRNSAAAGRCGADEGRDVMRFLSMILGMFLLSFGTALVPSESAAEDGKDLFIKHKCNECHSIKTAAIEVKPSDDAGEEDPFGGEEEGEEDEAPDLSSVGKEQDAAWIADYLKKKVKLDGKKHRKRFKGSDAELKTISTFLAGMKAD